MIWESRFDNFFNLRPKTDFDVLKSNLNFLKVFLEGGRISESEKWPLNPQSILNQSHSVYSKLIVWLRELAGFVLKEPKVREHSGPNSWFDFDS